MYLGTENHFQKGFPLFIIETKVSKKKLKTYTLQCQATIKVL